MVSDGDGALRWFERDGTTLVRQWNINAGGGNGSRHPDAAVSGSDPRVGSHESAGSEVVRKLLPLGEEARSEVVLWTGERIGLLQFGSTPDSEFWSDHGEPGDGTSTEESRYEESMRRALKRQADEVRWTQGLGLG